MNSRASRPATQWRIGRRSLLKAAGATAAATAASGMTAGIARAATKRNAAGDEIADAIIIGAGYAGGTVARELSAQGMSSIILEARDRIGGRIWTDTFAGAQVEVGGGWVGAQQVLVQRELSRYGITTEIDVAPERMMLPSENGFESMTPAEALAVLSPLWAEFYAGADDYFERPSEPLYRRDLLEGVDWKSLADRLDEIALSPTEFMRLNGETSMYSGGPSTIGALTGMAQWFQLAGGTYGSFLSTADKPAGGMIALLDAMLDDAQADVRFDSPVTSITESGGQVTVETTGGATFAAPVVVVATPTNVWKHISFQPGLPPAQAAAAGDGIGVPHSKKMWLHVSNKEAVTVQAEEGAPIAMLMAAQELEEGRLMVAFPGPSLDTSDAAAVRQAVQQLLPDTSVLEYRSQDWGRDPWSRGGWGLRRPNQLLDLFPQIEEPHGRILFAGADIAQGWHGAYIEGAVESGLRAAQQALSLA
ncbi:flavin monoamine oxidase family protein [Streptomyces johnsoniae]|uniref:FAD-dependent oxidoreductase n=1 Tax=Streptomyces johnsoniae TaxID=3075532 RepID=A0ABU2RXD7_9ACTN|nr:FAD-dependent oxidoreductase [Streptomyces sp. DSM 41886]MDT0441417.1 FAD-dependent oxidoreductase [Streptomyces sp. DSM 41886]